MSRRRWPLTPSFRAPGRPRPGRRRRPRLATLERLEDRVVLSTFTVLNTDDAGPGSLRAAIELAIADPDPDPDRIEFAPGVAGTIILRSELPELATELTLAGPGASVLTVTRSSSVTSSATRIFTVSAGAEVTISGLTITGGRAYAGGGISNAGTLSLTDSIVHNNSAWGGIVPLGVLPPQAKGGLGGGIWNSGTLSIARSTISNNRADPSYALRHKPDPPFPGMTPDAYTAGSGGGIYSTGTLTITDSVVSGNRVENVPYTLNQAKGAGIYSSGTTMLRGSYFGGNTLVYGGRGGDVYCVGATTIVNSTFSSRGATNNPGSVDWMEPNAGGGIFNAGSLNIIHSTFLGAPSPDSLYNSRTGDLTIGNSIIAPEMNGPTLVNDAGGTVVSLGHNIFTDAPTLDLDPTDRVKTDPLLAPLGDYGGPTATRPPLPGSPAIDAAAPVPDLTTDQRGFLRPRGAAPDIGAVEFQGPVNVTISPADGPALVGQEWTVTATVTDAEGRPLASVPVMFRVVAGPNAGAAGTIDLVRSQTDADGRVRFTYNGLGGLGTDTIVATTTIPAGAPQDSPPATIRWLDSIPPVDPPPVDPPPVDPPPTASPPTVVGLQRFGVHNDPTTLVVSFSGPLDGARAGDLSSYTLVWAGPDGRLGTRDDRTIPLARATFDATTNTVALRPRVRLPLNQRFHLTIRGDAQSGLTGTDGTPLDGDGDGTPGGDYAASFGREILATPTPAPTPTPIPTQRPGSGLWQALQRRREQLAQRWEVITAARTSVLPRSRVVPPRHSIGPM